MAVHAYVERMKLGTLAFEARFKDGYRYLDRCGESIVQIQSHNSSWLPSSVNPMAGALRNEEKNIQLVMNTQGLAFNFYKFPINLNGIETFVQSYALEAEAVYHIVVRALKVTETTRVGARFRFQAEADTLEEADRFVCNGVRSPLLDQIETSSRSRLRDAGVVYVVEDPESGYRRRVEIVSQVSQKMGEAPPTGLDREEGTGAVVIDIDTFTRPEQGHFENAGMFIQESFNRSRIIGMETFEWLRHRPTAPRRQS